MIKSKKMTETNALHLSIAALMPHGGRDVVCKRLARRYRRQFTSLKSRQIMDIIINAKSPAKVAAESYRVYTNSVTEHTMEKQRIEALRKAKGGIGR